MYIKKIVLSTLFLVVLHLFSFSSPLKKYQKNFTLMGSSFEIAAIAETEEIALNAIDSAHQEIVRIEKLISSWDKNSKTTLINDNAGIKPTIIPVELFNLIRRAIKVSKLSNGAFDISYASMDKLWIFDGSMTKLPAASKIKESISKINYKNILLDEVEHSVFLKEKGMKIGFGAIGKGYAANKARNIMIENGIKSGMINAGGDLIAWGDGLNGEKWKVGIADPKKEKAFISWLELNEMAVVTSGDYERFTIIDNIRYAHIIDPRTGYPAVGLKSVTIICPDAELADALATTVFVLGQERGLALINQLNAIECIIVNDKDEIHTSKTLKLNIQ
jgi:thiamine biosynthesis lipoprotein